WPGAAGAGPVRAADPGGLPVEPDDLRWGGEGLVGAAVPVFAGQRGALDAAAGARPGGPHTDRELPRAAQSRRPAADHVAGEPARGDRARPVRNPVPHAAGPLPDRDTGPVP